MSTLMRKLSFGFLGAENAQRLLVDTTVFIPVPWKRILTYAFSFGSTFESILTLMRFCQKLSASSCGHYRFHTGPMKTNIDVCVFIWIHFREHFDIDAVLPKTFSVLVWTLPFSYRFHEDESWRMRFHLDLLSRAFWHWCGFTENA